jgi:hypothetical protein
MKETKKLKKKYSVVVAMGIAAIFLFLVFFEAGQSKPIVNLTHKTASKAPKTKSVQQLADRDDMVAAIIIMPKSYLPALKRFSQSKMAKNIKILRARIEVQDGNMTAVYRTKKDRQQIHETAASDGIGDNMNTTANERSLEMEQPALATGFLYLLASVQKSKLFN